MALGGDYPCPDPHPRANPHFSTHAIITPSQLILEAKSHDYLKTKPFGERADENIKQLLNYIKLIVDIDQEASATAIARPRKAYYIRSSLVDKVDKYASHLLPVVVND